MRNYSSVSPTLQINDSNSKKLTGVFFELSVFRRLSKVSSQIKMSSCAVVTATRWGIAGCGKISSDFVNSLLSNTDRESHRVVACAARSLATSQEFAKKFDVQVALEGYQTLVNHQDVDVVYVGVIHPYHLKVTATYLAIIGQWPFTVYLLYTSFNFKTGGQDGFRIGQACAV